MTRSDGWPDDAARINSLEREVARLQTHRENDASTLAEIRKDVKDLRDILVTAKGARWAIGTIIGVGSALGATITTALAWWGTFK